MASNDNSPQPAPSGGGPPSNGGNGRTVVSGSAGDPEPSRRGISFGEYDLLEKIGESELSVVYKAHCNALGRLVAIRMWKIDLMGVEIERFVSRAASVRALNHPNIVPLYEAGQFERVPYFSMNYVAGRRLATIGDGKPLPAVRAVGYVMRIASALAYAHQCGVIHGNLNSSHVIVDEHDQPQVVGFDLPFEPEPILTAASCFTIGSIAYRSPEQVQGKTRPPQPATDIYALGVILYELLTARLPFSARSLQEICHQVVTAKPTPPRRVNPSVPRDLEMICLKCLEKDPTRRYATARALAEDLRRFLQPDLVMGPPRPWARKAKAWLRRRLGKSIRI